MRIAIDARLNAYRQGGIPQYTRQLLTALAEVAPDEQFISLQHRDQLRPLAIAPNVARRTVLTPPHHRLEGWALPLELLPARPNVLHSPDFIAPAHRLCPAVVTIHDLAFLHYPDILDEAASAFYSQVHTNTARANAVIAVSEATRQDIAQFLDIPIEQIDVIYEAAAPLYKPIEVRRGEARVLNATPIAEGSFMLFVSTLEPRKNLPTLLQALRICIDRRPDVGYKLVVAGRRGWRDDAIFAAVRDLRLEDHVFFAGSVGQYDLRWLYNACRLYINPSLYEGFGLPLLEAMACRAPCLAAATSSLPEIGGEAAIYVPPLEADTWADEIEALWDDEDRRAELGRRGLARAQQFSWLRAARETLAVYKRAAARIVERPEPLPLPPPIEPFTAAEATMLLGSRASIPAPGEARPCLRCGASMVAGEMQRNMLVHSSAPQNGQEFASRAWACPNCGHVELVVDWAAPARPDDAPLAELAVSAPTANPPAKLEDAIEDAAPIQPHSGADMDIAAELMPADSASPVLADPLVDLAATPEEEPEPAVDVLAGDTADSDLPVLTDPLADLATVPDQEAEPAADPRARDTIVLGDAWPAEHNATLDTEQAHDAPEPDAEQAHDATSNGVLGDGVSRNGTGGHEPLADSHTQHKPGTTHQANGTTSTRKKKPRASGQEQRSETESRTQRQSRSKRH